MNAGATDKDALYRHAGSSIQAGDPAAAIAARDRHLFAHRPRAIPYDPTELVGACC